MKLRKRRAESPAEPAGTAAAPAPEPVPATPPAPQAAAATSGADARGAVSEPVIEGEAVELPPEGGAADAPGFGGGGPASSRPHGDADTGPSLPKPVMELAEQRPEAVIGAAFVGGMLFAAILRRLGR
jgi:hypothetical protein